jgi:hypothetical protein
MLMNLFRSFSGGGRTAGRRTAGPGIGRSTRGAATRGGGGVGSILRRVLR